MTDITKNESPNEVMISSLNLANDMITKGYLEKLEIGEIAPLTTEDKDISVENSARFFNLTKLIINKKEKLIEQLTTIVNVAHATGGSIVTIIKSGGNQMQFYIGAISKGNRGSDNNSKVRTKATLSSFNDALLGNLVGSELNPIDVSCFMSLQNEIFSGSEKAICAVSGIPAFRNNDQDELLLYAQGIEHMIDSLRGQDYTIITIADPVSYFEIAQIKQGYELIYSQLATFLKTEFTLNETKSYSLSESQTTSITDSITKGIALTQSKTKTEGKSSSFNIGTSVGINLGYTASLNIGASLGKSSSISDTRGETKSDSETSAFGSSNTRSNTIGKSTGNSIQLSYENRTVKSLLEKIDKHLERLEMSGSFGAFDCATYIIADDRSLAISAASNFNAINRGEQSSIQASYINTWYKEGDVKKVAEYLKYFIHPKVSLDKNSPIENGDKLLFTPASIMTGKEATLLMAFPRQSVAGLPVLEMVPFGRNIEQKGYTDKRVMLGKLYHMSKDEAGDVVLDINSLTAHTFITGSTGAGKSNAIYQILEEVNKAGVKFLVIEPAKGEYKHIFGNRKDVCVFGTNPYKSKMLKINPFKFPKDIHVLEHIDRLVEIFNVCWPMYAAMPAVLKDAIERAYKSAGWNLDESTNHYDSNFFPCFIDVLEHLRLAIDESEFSQEVKSNYTGALIIRIKSLTNGINGQVFTANEIDNNILFNSNTIIDLSRVSSIETKAMIMGILVMRLQEYRISEGGMNRLIRHVTVLEEAHNLLMRTSTEQSSESSNLIGKSVEMLANSIAEMRTYGEGFIIADQSPNMLDLSVIRNTNTKIILRLPDLADRELVGKAAGLNDSQIVELAKLSTGIAAVYQNDWLEPVLCHVDKTQEIDCDYKYFPKATLSSDTRLKSTLLKCLLTDIVNEKVDYNFEDMKERIFNSAFPATTKLLLLKHLQKNEIKDIGDVSKVVSKLFNMDTVASLYAKNLSVEEWNSQIANSVGLSELRLNKPYENIILQCLLKEKSNIDTTFVDVYEKWTEYMRRTLL